MQIFGSDEDKVSSLANFYKVNIMMFNYDVVNLCDVEIRYTTHDMTIVQAMLYELNSYVEIFSSVIITKPVNYLKQLELKDVDRTRMHNLYITIQNERLDSIKQKIQRFTELLDVLEANNN